MPKPIDIKLIAILAYIYGNALSCRTTHNPPHQYDQRMPGYRCATPGRRSLCTFVPVNSPVMATSAVNFETYRRSINTMSKSFILAVKAAMLTALFVVAASAQTTTGTVSMSGTVSKFVEINSGGAVTLSGNSGGGVTTDGTANNPLAVVIDLGELGPSNTSSFVTANVPLKLRSNAAYVLSMSATVSSTGSTANKIGAADIGFGLGTVSRSGVGVNTGGTDTNATSGDPTLGANGSVNGTSGRYEYTATRSHLGAFSSSTTALSGAFIMNAVPRSNTNGLTVPAMFSVKPQFYEVGTTTATVTFTVTAP